MFKVFRYVTDKKVPYYVYNLYNELQFINKSVDVDIDKLGKSLESLEPEEHCSLLYNRLNNIGSSNCSNVKTKQLNSSSDNIVYKYDCTRTINLSVDKNGDIFSGKDPDIKKAKDDGTEWSSCSSYDSLYLQGTRQCTFNVQNVDPDLKQPFTNKEGNGEAAYTCKYDKKTGGDATIYDTVKLEDEQTLSSLNESFRSSNNIGFAFLTTYIDPPKYEKDEYSFKANITRCEICPDNNFFQASDNMRKYLRYYYQDQDGRIRYNSGSVTDLGNNFLNNLFVYVNWGANSTKGKDCGTSRKEYIKNIFSDMGSETCNSWLKTYETYRTQIESMIAAKRKRCYY